MHYVDLTPYADVSTCTVVGDTTQAAIGPVVTLTLDNKLPVKIQRSDCFNMDTCSVGDTFKVVVVYDDKKVLQSVTRVTDVKED